MPQYMGVYKGYIRGMSLWLVCEFVPSLRGPLWGVDEGVNLGAGAPKRSFGA